MERVQLAVLNVPLAIVQVSALVAFMDTILPMALALLAMLIVPFLAAVPLNVRSVTLGSVRLGLVTVLSGLAQVNAPNVSLAPFTQTEMEIALQTAITPQQMGNLRPVTLAVHSALALALVIAKLVTALAIT
jgi:hypothetical protein